MGLHDSYVSMLGESLVEMIDVADNAVAALKKPETGVLPGCYGYPGLLLLLTIVSTIGSFVKDTDGTLESFQILNDPSYYGLGLRGKDVEDIYIAYRNSLVHTSVLGYGFLLDGGREDSRVFERRNGIAHLHLVPFVKVTRKAVETFLANAHAIVPKSRVVENLMKKAKYSALNGSTFLFDLLAAAASDPAPMSPSAVGPRPPSGVEAVNPDPLYDRPPKGVPESDSSKKP
jgi:hypothetical protein